MKDFDLNNIYRWRITRIPPTAEIQKEELLKELQGFNKKRTKLKNPIYLDRHISLLLFDIKMNKKTHLYDIEEAFKNKKTLLKQLEAEAEEHQTTLNNIIYKYDNINIDVGLIHSYENWTD